MNELFPEMIKNIDIFSNWNLRGLEKYFILFIIYSFLGWAIETVRCSIRERKFVDRGFLLGPVIPIYGAGAILITRFLTRFYNDPIVLFIMAMVICGLLEYFTSFIMEKIFKARWWDYSDRKFNINGRVCLDNLVLFGILGLIIIYGLNTIIVPFVNNFSDKTMHILTIIFGVIILTDTCISFKVVTKVRSTTSKIITYEIKDNTAEITAKVREELSKVFMGRRLLNAFPNFSVLRDKIKDKAEEIKAKGEEQIEKGKQKIEESAKRIKDKGNERKEKIKNLAKNINKKD